LKKLKAAIGKSKGIPIPYIIEINVTFRT